MKQYFEIEEGTVTAQQISCVWEIERGLSACSEMIHEL